MAEAARLLDVSGTAGYLGGISDGAVRALVRQGMLVPVRLPSCRRPGESSRRLLFAREDLDALIDLWKRESTTAPNAQLSKASVKGWRSTPVRKRKQIADASLHATTGEMNDRPDDVEEKVR